MRNLPPPPPPTESGLRCIGSNSYCGSRLFSLFCRAVAICCLCIFVAPYSIYAREYRRVQIEVDSVCLAPHQPDHLQTTPRRRPLFAIKTNLLYDAAILTPNIEIEVPIGYHPWSIMAEWWTPWYVWGKGKMKTHAYSFMLAGLAVRYWFRDRQSDWCQPVMQGHFLGLYGAGGFYDIQPWRKDKGGWQGEYTSIGLTYGYVLPVAAHWSFEFSISAGYVGGPQRVYKSMFDNEHLIWQRNQHFWMIAPTKLKISISYMVTAKEKQKKTH